MAWSKGILQAIQPGPVPGGPAAHVLEDLLPVGQDASLRAEVVGIGAAGPRFWHDGTILTPPEFGLCSNLSLSGRVGRAEVPELRAM